MVALDVVVALGVCGAADTLKAPAKSSRIAEYMIASEDLSKQKWRFIFIQGSAKKVAWTGVTDRGDAKLG